MRSVLILSFSGTGNTKFVVDALVQSFIDKGIKSSSYPLEKLPFEKDPDALLAVDMIGIAFPVHAWNPPLIVEQIIKRFPETASKKCFIIKTSGSPILMGGTTTRLKSILRKRNWLLKYEALVPMPSNLMPRYSDAFIKLNVEMALLQADKIAEQVIDQDWRTIEAWKGVNYFSIIMRMERMGSLWFGHYLKVDDGCIKCGKCVRECPARNIKFSNGKFSFGWKCTFCMRCSFDCPVQAFNHKFGLKKIMINPPYNLKQIQSNPSIKPADITDDSIPNMKDFRQFWFRFGVID